MENGDRIGQDEPPSHPIPIHIARKMFSDIPFEHGNLQTSNFSSSSRRASTCERGSCINHLYIC